MLSGKHRAKNGIGGGEFLGSKSALPRIYVEGSNVSASPVLAVQ
jgi:hypothetical protein